MQLLGVFDFYTGELCSMEGFISRKTPPSWNSSYFHDLKPYFLGNKWLDGQSQTSPPCYEHEQQLCSWNTNRSGEIRARAKEIIIHWVMKDQYLPNRWDRENSLYRICKVLTYTGKLCSVERVIPHHTPQSWREFSLTHLWGMDFRRESYELRKKGSPRTKGKSRKSASSTSQCQNLSFNSFIVRFRTPF